MVQPRLAWLAAMQVRVAGSEFRAPHICCMQCYAPSLQAPTSWGPSCCLHTGKGAPASALHQSDAWSSAILISATSCIPTMRVVSPWRHHLAMRLQRMCMLRRVNDISSCLQEARTAAELALQLRAFDSHIDWDALRRPAAAEVDILFGGAEILERRQAGSAPPTAAVPAAAIGVPCCASNLNNGQCCSLRLGRAAAVLGRHPTRQPSGIESLGRQADRAVT